MIWPADYCGARILELPPPRELGPDPDSAMTMLANLVIQSCGNARPIIIFGHSLGGSMALALSEYLRRAGEDDISVILSAVPKPREIATISSAAVSGFVTRSLKGIFPRDVTPPQSYLKLLEGYIDQDLKVAPWLSSVGCCHLDKVVGFLIGNDDLLCGEDDLCWWLEVSPLVEFKCFEGGHFGYMDPDIAKIYRSFISRVSEQLG